MGGKVMTVSDMPWQFGKPLIITVNLKNQQQFKKKSSHICGIKRKGKENMTSSFHLSLDASVLEEVKIHREKLNKLGILMAGGNKLTIRCLQWQVSKEIYKLLRWVTTSER